MERVGREPRTKVVLRMIRPERPRARLTRFGDAREHDGPENAHQRFSHVSDDLRWAIITMSELHALSREQISDYTGIPPRTISRIKKSWNDNGIGSSFITTKLCIS